MKNKALMRKEYPSVYALINYLTLGYQVMNITALSDNLNAVSATLIKTDKSAAGKNVVTLSLFSNNQFANAQNIRNSTISLLENNYVGNAKFTPELAESLLGLSELYGDELISMNSSIFDEKKYMISKFLRDNEKTYSDYFENYYKTIVGKEDKIAFGNLFRGSTSYYHAVEAFEHFYKEFEVINTVRRVNDDLSNIIYSSELLNKDEKSL